MSKPSIPKGTRDFGPNEMAKRNYIFDTIKACFKKYGFSQIETPAMETTQTLLGKYGEEGDRLIFKVLDSGDFLNNEKIRIIGEKEFAYATLQFVSAIRVFFQNMVSKKCDSIENFLQSQIISKEATFYLYVSKFDINEYIKEFIKQNDNYFQQIIEWLLAENQNDLDFYIDREIKGENLISKFFEFVKSKEDKKGVKNEVKLYDDLNSLQFSTFISEKALRYDLTVPFARFVVQHQNEISFPFKRYQIQPVWRADRPQKGRYREFYQCDADMIGSNSLLNEIDLILLMDEVFGQLKIPVTIKLNNRKILSGLAEVTGEKDKLIDITVAIDKLDKIGEEKVIEEMKSKNISEKAIEIIKPILSFKGNTEEKFKLLEGILSSSETGMKGIEELKFIFSSLKNFEFSTLNLELDITLARGLNYYTGAIIEVKSNSEFSPSICGGGRYDDLTGIFGLPNMSGVGISFGADRIYDVMNDMNLFPENNDQQTQLLFINFGDAEAAQCLKLLVQARQENINAELYPDNAKMAKQMKYANDKKIPFVAMMGSNEMKEGKITIKNMESGEQKTIEQKDLISTLKK